MSRSIPHISSEAKAALELLVDTGTAPAEYGDGFYRLGQYLAKRLKGADLGRKTLVVCTSEDADFLARGIFESISEQTSRRTPVAFACFWQARFGPASETSNKKRFEVAPIVKRYEEPTDDEIDSLIIVQSIIATSCVVRHALLDTIERKHPRKIFVVAPVISKDAPDKLRAGSPNHVAALFRCVSFAKDDSPDENGMVGPGIGGSIYERLSLSKTGVTLTPKIVTARGRQYDANPLHVS